MTFGSSGTMWKFSTNALYFVVGNLKVFILQDDGCVGIAN
jgi:hypothetical protein